METIASILAKNRERLLFFFLITLSVVAMELTPETKISLVSMVGRAGFYPLHGAISFTTHIIHLKEQNEALMKKATILSLETLELSQLEAENQRLRKILDFRDRAQINLTVALIQSRSGGPVYTSMVINRGINDGIRESMPVVSPDGFVGKIRSVFANSAIVELLADPEMAVSVYGRKSRTLGVARWSYSEGYIVEDVPVRSGLKVGEILLTTGYGGAFPRGISVGVVSEIVSGESEMYLKVKFNPSADLCNLEEVMIVETKMPVTPLSAFSPSGQSFVAGPSDSIGAGWPEMVR